MSVRSRRSPRASSAADNPRTQPGPGVVRSGSAVLVQANRREIRVDISRVPLLFLWWLIRRERSGPLFAWRAAADTFRLRSGGAEGPRNGAFRATSSADTDSAAHGSCSRVAGQASTSATNASPCAKRSSNGNRRLTRRPVQAESNGGVETQPDRRKVNGFPNRRDARSVGPNRIGRAIWCTGRVSG